MLVFIIPQVANPANITNLRKGEIIKISPFLTDFYYTCKDEILSHRNSNCIKGWHMGPLMIYARQQGPKGNSDKVYDYVGCLYPQGYIDKNYVVFFQHEDIDKVLHRGLDSVAESEMEKLLHIPETA